MFASSRSWSPTVSLVIAATLWGVIWYPYRLLKEAGLSGSLATLLTYLVALLIMLSLSSPRQLWTARHHGLLLLVALTAGWTNLAYVLAVIEGEIMRVMLLFYLAPLWTLVFARLILGERAGPRGGVAMLLALVGVFIMLHAPGQPMPLPVNLAEWLAVSAGVTYALSNVLSRKLKAVSERSRAMWIFAGVVMIAWLPLQGEGESIAEMAGLAPSQWGLLVFTAVLLVLATLTSQHGLAHIAANRAIVILLLELVAAAYFSWLWAGESMGAQEWLGGGLIVMASLLSGKFEGERHA